MACYLRAWGSVFDVDAFLSTSPLTWDPVWRKGEKRKFVLKGRQAEYEDTGATTLVANTTDDLTTLVAGAIAFLRSNEAEVSRLARYPGVEQVFLDFGVAWHADSAAQFSRLPPELLALASQHGFWIEISHYLAAPNEGVE